MLNISSAWTGCALVVVMPIVSALVILYSDVNTLKYTKAETKEVAALQLKFTEQMTKNTTAIENLNETLRDWKEVTYEQQERSDRRRDRKATRTDNEMP